MNNEFWRKFTFKFFVVVIPTIVAVVTFLEFFVDLEQYTKKWGVLGGAFISSVISFVILVNMVNKELNNTREKVGDSKNLSQENDSTFMIETVNNIFHCVAVAVKFPQDTPKIVIHYFYYSMIGEIEYLVKDRRYCVEGEPRPIDYSMDKCRLNAKGMIMCKAFLKNGVVFENLPSNHIELYDEDVKNYIDSDISWVLACPVWKDNNIENKLGVLVIFGTENIVDENDKNRVHDLENICLVLSRCVSNYKFLFGFKIKSETK